MRKLLLIRHGQSEWNASGRWQGQANPPLTELGRQQAQLAVEKAGGLGLERIFSSDLDRARETAELLSVGIGLGSVIEERLLRERDAGEFSGLTHEEIERAFPGYLEADRRPPGYELDPPLLERIRHGLASVAEAAGKFQVLGVVAHGGIIRLLEETFTEARDLPVPNLCGRWVILDEGGEIFELGERILLIEGEKATTPDQI